MKKNDQITIDIEPAKDGESARSWAKELRSSLCEFLDEWAANNPAPIELTIDVGPLTYNPTESQHISEPERWEVGFRNIVTALGYARKPFEIAAIVDHVERIVSHYGVLRAELVETNAKAMFDIFQAAANPKDMDYCRTITNARLRGKCTACDGQGVLSSLGRGGDHDDTTCIHCDGAGYVEIPELPSGIESVTHNIVEQKQK